MRTVANCPMSGKALGRWRMFGMSFIQIAFFRVFASAIIVLLKLFSNVISSFALHSVQTEEPITSSILLF